MGASEFFHKAKGKNAKEAFDSAREDARFEYGHRPYTGTVAEKGHFIEIPVPAGEDASKFAERLMEERDGRIDDKRGPAGCVKIGEAEYLFFGWAPS